MPSREQQGRTHRFEAALPGQDWAGRLPALRSLFEHIEPRYDGLNRRLSLGLDRGWRAWTARALRAQGADVQSGPWLDLASGTGDLACALAEARPPQSNAPLVRLDLSALLLRAGERKLSRDRGADASPGIVGEMDHLPIRSGTLASVAQGFALRHCRDLAEFFRELHRVLRPGGCLAIIDMRYPRRGLGAAVYRFYFARVLPRIAALFGGDREAYEFMIDSVKALPSEENLLRALREAGFVDARSRPGIFGSVALLTARKP